MEIIGALFIIIFGTLGHFIFEWSGHRKWAGIFFAVNESTWEHIKLTIYPSFIWLVVEGIAKGWSCNLLVAQAAGMVTMMALIPIIFYSYTAIVGRNFLIADIITFMVSICIGMWLYHAILVYGAVPSAALTAVSITVLAAIAFMYFTFTYKAPHNFLFKDPISGGFGPTGHDCDGDFHKTGHAHGHDHKH